MKYEVILFEDQETEHSESERRYPLRKKRKINPCADDRAIFVGGK